VNNLCILVLSCDRYCGLWDLFFTRWERFWPSCPYPVCLITNQMEYDRPGVITIKTGDDIDWSTNLLKVLEGIPQENLLLMIEDAPLDSMVNGQDFARLYGRFQLEDLNYLNLKSSPAPNGVCDIDMGDLLPGTLYRAALVPCLWKKQVLKSLAIRGETAWHFEILGSERSDEFSNFRSTRRPFFKLLHCIIKGKLDRRAAQKLRKNEELQLIDFPLMTLGEQYSLYLRECRSYIFNILVPSMLRRSLRTIYYRLISREGRIF
jgi:hypothetical protein